MPGELGKAPASMWEQRNGLFHARPVDDTRRSVLYTTKDAALSGEIVFSDTLRRYCTVPAAVSRVDLYPAPEERGASLDGKATCRVPAESAARGDL